MVDDSGCKKNDHFRGWNAVGCPEDDSGCKKNDHFRGRNVVGCPIDDSGIGKLIYIRGQIAPGCPACDGGIDKLIHIRGISMRLHKKQSHFLINQIILKPGQVFIWQNQSSPV